jgi:hypothetical protein
MFAAVGRFQARFHRLTFVLGTVGLAIAGSRVANDVEEVGSWLLTLASIFLIAGSDVGQELASASKQLALKSTRPYAESLDAIVKRDAPKWLAAALLGGVLLAATAAVAYIVQDDDAKTSPGVPTGGNPSDTSSPTQGATSGPAPSPAKSPTKKSSPGQVTSS